MGWSEKHILSQLEKLKQQQKLSAHPRNFRIAIKTKPGKPPLKYSCSKALLARRMFIFLIKKSFENSFWFFSVCAGDDKGRIWRFSRCQSTNDVSKKRRLSYPICTTAPTPAPLRVIISPFDLSSFCSQRHFSAKTTSSCTPPSPFPSSNVDVICWETLLCNHFTNYWSKNWTENLATKRYQAKLKVPHKLRATFFQASTNVLEAAHAKINTRHKGKAKFE